MVSPGVRSRAQKLSSWLRVSRVRPRPANSNMTNNSTIALRLSALVSVAGLIVYVYFVLFSSPAAGISTVIYETVEILEPQLVSLKKLGLTAKKPVQITDSLTGTSKTIHGRFVHITDFHPDPFYKVGSSIERMCHGGKGSAGKYGDAIMGCDSPMELVDKTIEWVERNLKDKIDFIAWTGDNVRHDNDRMYPRTEADIMDLNQIISDKMKEKFGELPIPSLGNNDVYPHNLFAPGPTLQTREFFKIWRPFVPQQQFHTFNNGLYFFQEVIPNQLAVLSINTLYLFQSNPLVDSCDRKKDPGYKLFEWLGVVLQEMRDRNMKVWLTGHVPPNTKNFDISCLRKYVVWSHEYRDVIIGGLYGHMNLDHFIPLDSKMAYDSLAKKYSVLGFQHDSSAFENAEDDDDDMHLELEQLYQMYNLSTADNFGDLSAGPIQDLARFNLPKDVWAEGGTPSGKVGYMDTLRETYYANIKKKSKSGDFGERYSIVHVSTSVVPTFNPGVRVWEYNITGLQNASTVNMEVPDWDAFFRRVDQLLEDTDDDVSIDSPFATLEQKAEILKRDKTIPPKMPKNLPLGPAYRRQLFTPERYVQYYLDLEGVNAGEKEFEYEVEYATDNKVYDMKDLTTLEWLRLGRKLGEPIKDEKNGKRKTGTKYAEQLEKLWKSFLRNTFVSSDYEHRGFG